MMLKGDIHLHPQLEKPEGEAKAAGGLSWLCLGVS